MLQYICCNENKISLSASEKFIIEILSLKTGNKSPRNARHQIDFWNNVFNISFDSLLFYYWKRFYGNEQEKPNKKRMKLKRNDFGIKTNFFSEGTWVLRVYFKMAPSCLEVEGGLLRVWYENIFVVRNSRYQLQTVNYIFDYLIHTSIM